MAKASKRMSQVYKKADKDKTYSLEEAVNLISGLPKVRFAESLDIAIHLGIDSRRSDQNVRGVTTLPGGVGKKVRVAVLAVADSAEAAKEAGADLVGGEDLIESIKGGALNFDLLIAHPEMMRQLAPLGRVLGPRGLMPNPRSGTVSADVAQAVVAAKAGQFRFRNDKAGIVHGSIGRVGFPVDTVQENLQAVIRDLQRAKPPESKGVYLQKIYLSSTMGPGLRLDLASIGI